MIAATPEKWPEIAFGNETSGWAYGQVARARGDKEKTATAFATARNELETKFCDEAEDPQYLAELAILDAGLGRKGEAIQEARRAVELEPIAKDAVNGPTHLQIWRCSRRKQSEISRQLV